LFCELIQVYNSYWKDDPTFDASNTRAAAPHLPCPHVDLKMLRRLAKFAISINFNSPRDRPAEPRFDVARALEAYIDPTFQPVDNAASHRLGLRVTGHGGGDWNVWLTADGIRGADLGLNSRCEATIECDVELLADLSRGRVSVDEAFPGLVQVTGGSVPRQAVVRVLKTLVEFSNTRQVATH
jgi:hypothetical protein